MNLYEILALSLLIISCGNSTKPHEENENQINYEKHIDFENGFVLEYPKTWEEFDSMPQPYMLFVVKENNSDTTDIFTESMNLTKLPNEGKNLRQIIDQNLEMIKQHRPNYKVSQKNILTEKGFETILLQADFKEQGINLSSMAVFFSKGPSLYTLTHTVESSKAEDYREIFGHAVNSFEWTKK